MGDMERTEYDDILVTSWESRKLPSVCPGIYRFRTGCRAGHEKGQSRLCEFGGFGFEHVV